MDNYFLGYIQQLELMFFFTGYSFVYAILYFIAREKRKKSNSFLNKAFKLLPYAYALTGTLFAGMVLKNASIDFSIENISQQFQNPYLKIWGLMAILFWFPALSNRTIYSLLHSLVFFFLLLKDLYLHFNNSIGKEIISNDIKVFTDSLLLNLGTLLFIFLIDFGLQKIKKRLNISIN